LIEFDPAAKENVVKVAMPPDSVPVPSVDEPFLKVTTPPFGGTPKLEPTVAVNVTLWSGAIGFAEDKTAVAVGSPWTTCFRVGEDLPNTFTSPP
jgi:hypothetical protein